MPEEPQNSTLYQKEHFLKAVREKYPEYADKPDNEVMGDYLTRFPQYYNQIDWRGAEAEKKKGVQDPYESPSGFTALDFASEGGSSGTAPGTYESPKGFTVLEFASRKNPPKKENELDLFPAIYHKVKQIESIVTEAEGVPNEGINIRKMFESGSITYQDEKGKPCAAAGARNIDFSWGNKWEVVKDLKGMPSHAQGGVDLTLDDNGVRFKHNSGKEIHAAHGLLLPNDGDKKKPSFEEYYATVPPEKNDTTTYDLRAAFEELPYKEMKRFAKSDAHLPDTYKLPTHPTFSTDSKYHTPEQPGGKWEKVDGKWFFEPSEANIKVLGGIKQYEEWWKANEPGVELMIPQFQQDPNKKMLFEDKDEK